MSVIESVDSKVRGKRGKATSITRQRLPLLGCRVKFLRFTTFFSHWKHVLEEKLDQINMAKFCPHSVNVMFTA